jgi:hypothetical protein
VRAAASQSNDGARDERPNLETATVFSPLAKQIHLQKTAQIIFEGNHSSASHDSLKTIALMKTYVKHYVLTTLLSLFSGALFGQSTAFTYHGILNHNHVPVTGLYDMLFAVYDVENGGTSLVTPLPKDAVGVTNGLFTVRIDFFGGVFTGPPRWLEVKVRKTGTVPFETLTPRQEMTSSPYSIRAQTAGTAADVSTGAVVKSLNSLKDDVTLSAGANVTIAPSGNTLTISSTGTGGNIWSLNGASTYYNASVGIGTNNPATRLTVAGSGIYNSPTAAALTLNNTIAGRLWEWHALDDGRLQLADFTAAATRMVVDTAGNFGFGTVTPASKLTVSYPGFGLEHTGGNVRLATYVSSDGLFTDGGWLGTISNHKLHLYVNNGQPSVTVSTAGDVGIGTTTPQERLTIANVFGQSSGLKITGPGVAGVGMAIENLFPGGHKWDLVSGDVFNPSIPSASGNFRIVDETANATRLVIDPNGNVGIGNLINPQAKLDVQGTTRTKVLTITGGADIAEPFPFSSANIPQGSVMVIDEENPGRLKLSTEPYDTRVAGIVSGANGIRPGISLQQEGALDGGQNVALSGRVYVLADATNAAIKPGDLLTSSSTPGHAMRVADHARAQGAILGKAMSGLKESKGTVLVLVTLQ